MVKTPVLAFKNGVQQKVEVEIPVLDVHEVLSHIHCQVGICTPECKVREYWEHQKRHGVPHAMHFPSPDPIKHIPFSLCGDETNLGGDANEKATAVFLSLTLFRPSGKTGALPAFLHA